MSHRKHTHCSLVWANIDLLLNRNWKKFKSFPASWHFSYCLIGDIFDLLRIAPYQLLPRKHKADLYKNKCHIFQFIAKYTIFHWWKKRMVIHSIKLLTQMYAWHIFLSLEKKNNYSIFIFLIYEKQSFSWFFFAVWWEWPSCTISWTLSLAFRNHQLAFKSQLVLYSGSKDQMNDKWFVIQDAFFLFWRSKGSSFYAFPKLHFSLESRKLLKSSIKYVF